jgi:hypothetical protein
VKEGSKKKGTRRGWGMEVGRKEDRKNVQGKVKENKTDMGERGLLDYFFNARSRICCF